MIDKIKLANFKCFNQAEFPMNQLTVLAGANAAGKSTVIQALLLAKETDRMGKNQGGQWNRVVVDVNQIFGFPVGAPNALVSQNPIEDGDYDFSVTLFERDQEYPYAYEINLGAPLELFVKEGSSLMEHSVQYLNAERIGPRMSNQAGKSDGISMDGENAAYLIDVADRTGRTVGRILRNCFQESGKFSFFVESWMSAILGNMQLDIHTDYNKAITELRIKNGLVDNSVVPTLTGFGISYVLPIVVAGLWASSEDGALLLLENPEAHLHPYAQSNMGKFLALLAVSGVQVIVETHSEHIIDGARYQMACMDQAERMVVNFMENADACIRTKEIYVSPKGELSSWPKGFFDQKQRDLRDILMLRKKDDTSR